MTGQSTRHRPKRLYILTGEASGDAHAARVIACIREQWPDVQFRGMGGKAMELEGVELIENVSNTAIMGFAEVISKLGFLRNLIARVKADIIAFRPDRLLIVDYPGFNLRLARWARKQGLSVDMYIGPQVWAWKGHRIHAMERDLDRLSVILPFEVKSYRGLNLDVEFVGHPLLDTGVPDLPTTEESAAWKSEQGLSPDAKLLALLPGSRPQEIRRMLPVFLKAAAMRPDLLPVVAGAPGRFPEDYATDCPVLFGQTTALYKHADAGLITSGTATLEAALLGLPQVVAYRTSRVTYTLAKAFSKVKFISLVNLILQREAVPERIQGKCTPKMLIEALDDITTQQGKLLQRENQSSLREKLGTVGASKRVAKSLMRPIDNTT